MRNFSQSAGILPKKIEHPRATDSLEGIPASILQPRSRWGRRMTQQVKIGSEESGRQGEKKHQIPDGTTGGHDETKKTKNKKTNAECFLCRRSYFTVSTSSSISSSSSSSKHQPTSLSPTKTKMRGHTNNTQWPLHGPLPPPPRPPRARTWRKKCLPGRGKPDVLRISTLWHRRNARVCGHASAATDGPQATNQHTHAPYRCNSCSFRER